MNKTVRCSNCGGTEDLHFITLGAAGSDFQGRTLVYCAPCRQDKGEAIDVSLPLQLLTPEIFRDLYAMGKTASHPEMAIDIVFGKPDAILQRELEAIIEHRAGDSGLHCP
jgi:hypothetical protein